MKTSLFKIAALLAAACLVLPAPGRAQTKLKVVTTLPDLADFAGRIGGGKIEVFALSSGKEDPHNVLIRPSMITRLARADLFVVMGLDLEHAYAPALLAECRNRKIQPGRPGYLDCSRKISARDIPKSLDASEGDLHAHGNPHYNLDPQRMKIAAGEIAGRLAELDPANAAFYKANSAALAARLDAKTAEWKRRLDASGNAGLRFVSYHPDWVYFAERFGVKPVGTIQPKPGVEPGPRSVKELIARMKSEGVPLIVKESYFSDRLPKRIAAATGARVVTVPMAVHATPEATDYFSMMETILNAFVRQ